ncbi:MAG: hypothetical protein ABI378_11370 [Chitinophagaceae bacterium]
MLQRPLFLLLLVLNFNANAQCISGNCKDGKGKFDFGWCSYEGSFKNGKPHGEGTMTYSDYTYSGTFKDGVEDGDGFMSFPDGRKEHVRYLNGKKIESPVKVAAGDYQSIEGHDQSCVLGDCNNGFGTYQFPSGNKYVGNFKNRKREGSGTFYFSNGEQFTGTFHDNNYNQGTYTFSTGASFTGSFDANNNPLNGYVSAGSKKVMISNGKGIIPKEERYGYENTETTRKAAEKRGEGAKPQTTPWGYSQSSKEHQADVSRKAASDVQKMLDHMERPYYTHW